MFPESCHRPRFVQNSLALILTNTHSLDEGEGDIAVEDRVVDQIDCFGCSFPQQPVYLKTATPEGIRYGDALIRWGKRFGGRIRLRGGLV